MHRLAIPLVMLCASACATPPPVSLDLYRGVYATHFDGVPNRAAVCAVLTNRAAHDVDWVRLRLRTYPAARSSREVRWTSFWTYRERLRPGETRTVRFVRPPVGNQVDLEVRDAGFGRAPSSGRPVVDAESCSEPGLQQDVQATQKERTAPGIAVYPIVRRNDPAPVVLVQDR